MTVKRLTMNCSYCSYYDDCTAQMRYYCEVLKKRLVEKGVLDDRKQTIYT